MYNNTGNTNVLFNNASSYTVSVAGGPAITGVTVTNNGVTSFLGVTFTTNSVTFDTTGSTWDGGTSVLVTLQFAP